MRKLWKKLVKIPFEKKSLVFEGFALYQRKDKQLCGIESKNCACVGGVLKTGIGGKEFINYAGMEVVAPSGVELCGIYLVDFSHADNSLKEEKILAFTKNGEMLLYDQFDGVWTEVAFVGKDAKAEVVYGADGDMRIVVAGRGRVLAFDKQFDSVLIAEGDTRNALCLCKNRVLFLDGVNGLRYSDPILPWDFTSTIDGGGELRLPTDFGESVGLVSVGESVYVLFERGIVRVKVAGRARDFEIEKVAYSGGKILHSSACELNGYGVFLATDGLYAITGKETKGVCKELSISARFDTQAFCDCAVFNGKGVWQYTDENGERKCVVLDGDLKSGYFSEVVDGLGGREGVALFRRGDKVYSLCLDGDLSDGERYSFKTGVLSFGGRERKCLKEITFEGDGSFLLGVDYGDGYFEKALVFENGIASARVDGRGRSFSFTFTLDKGTTLRKMTAEMVKLS